MVLCLPELKQLHSHLRAAVGASWSGQVDLVSDRHLVRGTALYEFRAHEPEFGSWADRERSGRCPVLRIPRSAETAPGAWAGWFEEWEVAAGERAAFVSASWTFYWGTVQPRKYQLFRAEWHRVAGERGQVAQPHWHFDRRLVPEFALPSPGAALEPLGASASAAGDGEASLGLVPADSSFAIQDLPLQGVHLGMAGWGHSDSHPACWQHGLSGPRDLLRWATRTLDLAVREFRDRVTAGEILQQ